MARIDYREAAVRVRMTTILLRWFAANWRDGMPALGIDADGTVDEDSLVAFDTALRAGSPTKDIRQGVTDELFREARGRCGMCTQPIERLQRAHIDRVGKERPKSDHCNHPHNLIMLCGTCHDRYDGPASSITNDAVRHRKEQLLSALLEDVARDVAIAAAMRSGVGSGWHGDIEARMSTILQTVGNQRELTDQLTQLREENSALRQSHEDTRDEIARLREMIAPTLPVTSGTLGSFLSQVNASAPPRDTSWLYVDPEPDPREGVCARCSEPALLGSYTCRACDHEGDEYDLEEPLLGHRGDEIVAILLPDSDGGSTEAQCANCRSTDLEFTFSDLCGYCHHMLEKTMRE